MPSATHTVMLAATPERVFEFVTAVRFFPVWLATVDAVQAISTSAVRAGTTFEVRRRGQSVPESWIVSEWEAGRLVRFTEYRADIQLRCEMQSARQETQLVVRVEWPNRGGLLGHLIPAMSPGSGWSRAVARSLPKLKELIVLNQDIKLVHGMGDE